MYPPRHMRMHLPARREPAPSDVATVQFCHIPARKPLDSGPASSYDAIRELVQKVHNLTKRMPHPR